ncbi:MAG: redoxin domain-containing protein [Planctomycetales bacterium]|nr:redoxin domain-containing protein [Planctomycetales bacterium]
MVDHRGRRMRGNRVVVRSGCGRTLPAVALAMCSILLPLCGCRRDSTPSTPSVSLQAAVPPGDASPASVSTDTAWLEQQVVDLDGTTHRLFRATDRAALLVFFLQDCPIANAYAPRIERIHQSYGPRGIRCLLVQVDARATIDQLRKHAVAYGLTMPVMHDRQHELVKLAGATVSPQAVVIDATGRVRYSGRIDDQYVELGKKRPAATRHDLTDALESVLAGREVQPPTTRAVGCYLESDAH